MKILHTVIMLTFSTLCFGSTLNNFSGKLKSHLSSNIPENLQVISNCDRETIDLGKAIEEIITEAKRFKLNRDELYILNLSLNSVIENMANGSKICEVAKDEFKSILNVAYELIPMWKVANAKETHIKCNFIPNRTEKPDYIFPDVYLTEYEREGVGMAVTYIEPEVAEMYFYRENGVYYVGLADSDTKLSDKGVTWDKPGKKNEVLSFSQEDLPDLKIGKQYELSVGNEHDSVVLCTVVEK